MKPEWVTKLEAEPCECVRCEFCKGTGIAVFDIGGRYVGVSRFDDLCEVEPCDECGGSGIANDCDRCSMLTDYEEDEVPYER